MEQAQNQAPAQQDSRTMGRKRQLGQRLYTTRRGSHDPGVRAAPWRIAFALGLSVVVDFHISQFEVQTGPFVE
jgi:hypothetical protein